MAPPITSPRTAAAAVNAAKISRGESGLSRTKTRFPLSLDCMRLDELLLKAFWSRLIMARPGTRNARLSTPGWICAPRESICAKTIT